MKDTLRLIISWKCNLNCDYCCNKIPALRDQFKEVSLKDIDFTRYSKLAITGGEPLIDETLLFTTLMIAKKSNPKIFTILNTNGLLLGPTLCGLLETVGLAAINVGLHPQVNMDTVIEQSIYAVAGTRIALRFNVWDKLAGSLAERWPGITIRPWVMDSCDCDNEDRMVLAGGAE